MPNTKLPSYLQRRGAPGSASGSARGSERASVGSSVAEGSIASDVLSRNADGMPANGHLSPMELRRRDLESRQQVNTEPKAPSTSGRAPLVPVSELVPVVSALSGRSSKRSSSSGPTNAMYQLASRIERANDESALRSAVQDACRTLEEAWERDVATAEYLISVLQDRVLTARPVSAHEGEVLADLFTKFMQVASVDIDGFVVRFLPRVVPIVCCSLNSHVEQYQMLGMDVLKECLVTPAKHLRPYVSTILQPLLLLYGQGGRIVREVEEMLSRLDSTVCNNRIYEHMLELLHLPHADAKVWILKFFTRNWTRIVEHDRQNRLLAGDDHPWLPIGEEYVFRAFSKIIEYSWRREGDNVLSNLDDMGSSVDAGRSTSRRSSSGVRDKIRYADEHAMKTIPPLMTLLQTAMPVDQLPTNVPSVQIRRLICVVAGLILQCHVRISKMSASGVSADDERNSDVSASLFSQTYDSALAYMRALVDRYRADVVAVVEDQMSIHTSTEGALETATDTTWMPLVQKLTPLEKLSFVSCLLRTESLASELAVEVYVPFLKFVAHVIPLTTLLEMRPELEITRAVALSVFQFVRPVFYAPILDTVKSSDQGFIADHIPCMMLLFAVVGDKAYELFPAEFLAAVMNQPRCSGQLACLYLLIQMLSRALAVSRRWAFAASDERIAQGKVSAKAAAEKFGNDEEAHWVRRFWVVAALSTYSKSDECVSTYLAANNVPPVRVMNILLKRVRDSLQLLGTVWNTGLEAYMLNRYASNRGHVVTRENWNPQAEAVVGAVISLATICMQVAGIRRCAWMKYVPGWLQCSSLTEEAVLAKANVWKVIDTTWDIASTPSESATKSLRDEWASIVPFQGACRLSDGCVALLAAVDELDGDMIDQIVESVWGVLTFLSFVDSGHCLWTSDCSTYIYKGWWKNSLHIAAVVFLSFCDQRPDIARNLLVKEFEPQAASSDNVLSCVLATRAMWNFRSRLRGQYREVLSNASTTGVQTPQIARPELGVDNRVSWVSPMESALPGFVSIVLGPLIDLATATSVEPSSGVDTTLRTTAIRTIVNIISQQWERIPAAFVEDFKIARGSNDGSYLVLALHRILRVRRLLKGVSEWVPECSEFLFSEVPKLVVELKHSGEGPEALIGGSHSQSASGGRTGHRDEAWVKVLVAALPVLTELLEDVPHNMIKWSDLESSGAKGIFCQPLNQHVESELMPLLTARKLKFLLRLLHSCPRDSASIIASANVDFETWVHVTGPTVQEISSPGTLSHQFLEIAGLWVDFYQAGIVTYAGLHDAQSIGDEVATVLIPTIHNLAFVLLCVTQRGVYANGVDVDMAGLRIAEQIISIYSDMVLASCVEICIGCDLFRHILPPLLVTYFRFPAESIRSFVSQLFADCGALHGLDTFWGLAIPFVVPSALLDYTEDYFPHREFVEIVSCDYTSDDNLTLYLHILVPGNSSTEHLLQLVDVCVQSTVSGRSKTLGARYVEAGRVVIQALLQHAWNTRADAELDLAMDCLGQLCSLTSAEYTEGTYKPVLKGPSYRSQFGRLFSMYIGSVTTSGTLKSSSLSKTDSKSKRSKASSRSYFSRTDKSSTAVSTSTWMSSTDAGGDYFLLDVVEELCELECFLAALLARVESEEGFDIRASLFERVCLDVFPMLSGSLTPGLFAHLLTKNMDAHGAQSSYGGSVVSATDTTYSRTTATRSGRSVVRGQTYHLDWLSTWVRKVPTTLAKICLNGGTPVRFVELVERPLLTRDILPRLVRSLSEWVTLLMGQTERALQPSGIGAVLSNINELAENGLDGVVEAIADLLRLCSYGEETSLNRAVLRSESLKLEARGRWLQQIVNIPTFVHDVCVPLSTFILEMASLEQYAYEFADYGGETILTANDAIPDSLQQAAVALLVEAIDASTRAADVGIAGDFDASSVSDRRSESGFTSTVGSMASTSSYPVSYFSRSRTSYTEKSYRSSVYSGRSGSQVTSMYSGTEVSAPYDSVPTDIMPDLNVLLNNFVAVHSDWMGEMCELGSCGLYKCWLDVLVVPLAIGLARAGMGSVPYRSARLAPIWQWITDAALAGWKDLEATNGAHYFPSKCIVDVAMIAMLSASEYVCSAQFNAEMVRRIVLITHHRSSRTRREILRMIEFLVASKSALYYALRPYLKRELAVDRSKVVLDEEEHLRRIEDRMNDPGRVSSLQLLAEYIET